LGLIGTAIYWSGWVFAAFGLVFSLLQLREARSQRQRNEMLTHSLERAYYSESRVTPSGGRDGAIARTVLIRIASAGRPFAEAERAAMSIGLNREILESTARELKTRGLLAFEGALEKTTQLHLLT
jgi:hypothetical protein